jgi:hypothetical protein
VTRYAGPLERIFSFIASSPKVLLGRMLLKRGLADWLFPVKPGARGLSISARVVNLLVYLSGG